MKSVETKPSGIRRLTVAMFHIKRITELPCQRYLLLALIPHMEANRGRA